MFLQQALEGGAAEKTIASSSQTGEQYESAVEYLSLPLCYLSGTCPCPHSPTFKEGTGKEFNLLHEVLQNHTRAIKCMGEDDYSLGCYQLYPIYFKAPVI